MKRDRDDLKRPLPQAERVQMTENELKIREYKVANFRQWLFEEAAAVANLKQEARILNRVEYTNNLSSFKSDLSISRVLGHKSILPGSGQWRINKKFDKTACWYCANWVFSLIFWNQEIGIRNANNNINIESREKKRVIELIRQNDPDYMSHPDVPMLFSNATNWRGKPFMKLIDFIMKAQETPDFSYQAAEIAKEKHQFHNLKELDSEKRS